MKEQPRREELMPRMRGFERLSFLSCRGVGVIIVRPLILVVLIPVFVLVLHVPALALFVLVPVRVLIIF